MANSVVQPKCPECGVSGVEHIAQADSAITSRGGDPWFNIAYCDKCGHVYGVFAKITYGPTQVPLPSFPLTGA
jgi:hypothetical protein